MRMYYGYVIVFFAVCVLGSVVRHVAAGSAASGAIVPVSTQVDPYAECNKYADHYGRFGDRKSMRAQLKCERDVYERTHQELQIK